MYVLDTGKKQKLTSTVKVVMSAIGCVHLEDVLKVRRNYEKMSDFFQRGISLIVYLTETMHWR